MRLLTIFLLFLITSVTYAQDPPLNLLKLPKGFKIDIYATPLPDAREMTLGSTDIVFVGSLNAGNVYAVIPDATKPHGTRVMIIATNLNQPNGVAFHNGALFVAEKNRILRFDDIEHHLNAPLKPVIVNNEIPGETDHGWHFIRFSPDEKLYIGVGAPCNACLSKDPNFATIMRMNSDGSNLEIYASGVRDSVGFDWDPINHELWFTDNGRDWMGNKLPPDKLNYAPIKGMNFGFPYYHGKDAPDPIYGNMFPSSEFTQAVLELPAHVAPLGMSFYTGKQFPADYQNQIFIAEHGSWNRRKKVGYQVIAVKLDNNQVKAVRHFITGWLQGQKAWGRPVATLAMPDGSLLISDDLAGVIYRVSYNHN